MELSKELTEKVETASKKDAKKNFEEAGMNLTDEELEQVAGGMPIGTAITDKLYGHQLR